MSYVVGALTTYGPPLPCSHFKRALWKVRGTDRNEIRSRILKIQTLHDRAVDLQVDSSPLATGDLLLAFAGAFSPEVSCNLENDVNLLLKSLPLQDTFQALFDRARTGTDNSFALAPVVEVQPSPSSPAPSAKTASPPPPTTNEDILAALKRVLKDQEISLWSSKRRVFFAVDGKVVDLVPTALQET